MKISRSWLICLLELSSSNDLPARHQHHFGPNPQPVRARNGSHSQNRRRADRHQHYCRCRASLWCRVQSLPSSHRPRRIDPRFYRSFPLRITSRSRVRHPPQPSRRKGQNHRLERSSYRRPRALARCNSDHSQHSGIRHGKNTDLRKLAALTRLNPVLQLRDWAVSCPGFDKAMQWTSPVVLGRILALVRLDPSLP